MWRKAVYQSVEVIFSFSLSNHSHCLLLNSVCVNACLQASPLESNSSNSPLALRSLYLLNASLFHSLTLTLFLYSKLVLIQSTKQNKYTRIFFFFFVCIWRRRFVQYDFSHITNNYEACAHKIIPKKFYVGHRVLYLKKKKSHTA